MPKDYYTIPEFCREAGFSRQYLYTLWEKGEGPERHRVRVGKYTYIHIPVLSASEWFARRVLNNARKEFENAI